MTIPDFSYMRDKLSTLNKREKEVLEAFCNGWSIKKTARKLFISIATVKSNRGSVYVKLELKGFEHEERRKIIREEICPALKELSSKPSPAFDVQNDVPVEISPYVERIVDDDEKYFLVESEVVDIKPEPVERDQRRRFPWRGVLIILLLGIVLGGFAVYYVLTGFDTFQPNSVVHTGVSTGTAPVGSVPDPTGAPEQEVAVITATSELSDAGSISSESSYFSDDFNAAPDPAWNIVYGNLGMAKGSFTVTGMGESIVAEHLAIIEGIEWENFSIKCNVQYFYEGEFGMIILRYQEAGDSLGLVFFPANGGVEFGFLQQNKRVAEHRASFISGGTSNFSFGYPDNLVEVQAVGNTYYAYKDGELFTSATIESPTNGKVGLYFRSNPNSNDPASYAPRFDYCTVEPLP